MSMAETHTLIGKCGHSCGGQSIELQADEMKHDGSIFSIIIFHKLCTAHNNNNLCNNVAIEIFLYN